MHIKRRSSQYTEFLNRSIYAKNGNTIVGITFYSPVCGKYTVLEKTTLKKYGETLYKIQFEYTGETYLYLKKDILHGTVSDCMYPTVYGAGCIGNENDILAKEDRELHDALYSKWIHMIGRVYGAHTDNYKNYGMLGVTVSDEFRNFSKYCRAIPQIEGFDRDGIVNGTLEIDKDMKQLDLPISQRIYSRDTISFLTHRENSLITDQSKVIETYGTKLAYLNIGSKDYAWRYYDSSLGFAKQAGLPDAMVIAALKGKIRHVKNYIFRYLTSKELSKRYKNNDIISYANKQDIINAIGAQTMTKNRYFLYKDSNTASYYKVCTNRHVFAKTNNFNLANFNSAMKKLLNGKIEYNGFTIRRPTDEELLIIIGNNLTTGDKLIESSTTIS